MCRTLGRLLLPLLVCLPAVAGSSAADAQPFRWVVRVYYDDVGDIRDLMEFDLWEFHDAERGYVLVGVDEDDYARLEALGLRTEVDEALTVQLNAPREIPPEQTTAIPGYPCYRTVEEAYATAAQMAAERPDLATWIDIGDSWDKINGNGGYDLMVLRLTNAAVPGPKPKFFVTSSIHPREYTPAELSARFAEYLFDHYDVDPDVTWILDHHEIHLMIMANPDGRKQAEQGAFWRKNVNENYCTPTSDLRGADLNRNFQFEWACCGGASNNPCHELYRGPLPASEPEVIAIQNYLMAEFPDQKGDALNDPAPDDATGIYFDIHSAVQLVLWPWGFGGNSPNSDQLRTFGRKLAWFNDYDPKQAIELYPTDGTTIDFGYGELGLASMAYEIGFNFFESCGLFESITLPDNLASLLYAAKVPRTPYRTPAGPDALEVTVEPATVFPGGVVDLTAVLDDTRFNNSNGAEPTQAIAAAEFYVDLPPWVAESAPLGMAPVDGSFDSAVESAAALIDTTGLSPGRHTIFVRGQDASGSWGAFGAAFVTISDANGDDDADGVANGVDCDPNDGTVWALPSAAGELVVTTEASDNLSWQPPAEPGALLLRYQVLRGTAADDFESATCVVNGTADPVATDVEVPQSGQVYFYLVRTKNRCGENLGADSAGAPRTGAGCFP